MAATGVCEWLWDGKSWIKTDLCEEGYECHNFVPPSKPKPAKGTRYAIPCIKKAKTKKKAAVKKKASKKN